MSATDSLPFFEIPEKPDFSIEARMQRQGKQAIAGVDEVGRGPLAGPVVAAAVILDPENIPEKLNDSKKMSEHQREAAFSEILSSAQVAWASLPAPVIDTINIREASLRAMTIAVKRLPLVTDGVLVDGRDVPADLVSVGEAFVKGDARSVSIAAASIVAKVIRDRIMVEAEREFPGYGFASHKGYAAAVHRAAIASLGPCAIHRRSFAPIKNMI